MTTNPLPKVWKTWTRVKSLYKKQATKVAKVSLVQLQPGSVFIDGDNRVTNEMFQYTNNAKYLTDEQRKFYEDNGYLVVPKLVDDDVLESCRSRFSEVSKIKPPIGKLMPTIEPSLKNKNLQGEFLFKAIQNLLEDEVFFKFCSTEALVNVVDSIIGPNITCFHTIFHNKPPNADPKSSQHVVHQDYYYFPLEPVDSIVAAWIAVDDCTRENGCLFVYPGSHKNGLQDHIETEENKGLGYSEAVNHNRNITYLPVGKGDAVFLHPLVLHGSEPNTSQGFRKAILVFYLNNDCYFVDLKGTERHSLQNLLFEGYKRKFPHLKNYMDAFKFRSKLLRGTPGSYQECLNNI